MLNRYFSLVLVMVLFSAFQLFSFTAKRLYFTTNTLQAGTSVKPGFDFFYIWNGVGQARSGKIYVAISNHDETQGGGDVCVVEYNPYTNAMRYVGTIATALQAAGNYAPACNKVHTWLTGTPDGKVWLSSEEAGYGAHLMYIDPADGALKDYSSAQKYIILSGDLTKPVLNQPAQSPSAGNRVSVEGYSLKTIGVNMKCPQYLWTEIYGDYYMTCWDLLNDTLYSYPGGHKDLRIVLVAPNGNLFYKEGNDGYRMTPQGQIKSLGTNAGYTASAFVYSRNFDTAYTVGRGAGVVEMYTFADEKITVLADLPDGSNTNEAFRSVAISKDGKSLFILGGSGTVYELNIATKQYANIGSISSYLGGAYAFSSGLMDTLGNWYVLGWGNSQAFLIQVNLGTDKAWQMPMDPPTAIETPALRLSASPMLSIMPNPVMSRAIILISSSLLGEAPCSARLMDVSGRKVWETGGAETGAFREGRIEFNAKDFPQGAYILNVLTAKRMLSSRITLLK